MRGEAVQWVWGSCSQKESVSSWAKDCSWAVSLHEPPGLTSSTVSCLNVAKMGELKMNTQGLQQGVWVTQ